VAISSWVGACLFTPLPFEDHPSMSDRLEKQAPGKADQGNNGNDTHMETMAMIHTWIVSSLM